MVTKTQRATPRTSDRYGIVEADETVTIYDKGADDAWIKSDLYVALTGGDLNAR